MFPTSYFPHEYYAPRYFPRNGDIPPAPICITSVSLVPKVTGTIGMSNSTSITALGLSPSSSGSIELEQC